MQDLVKQRRGTRLVTAILALAALGLVAMSVSAALPSPNAAALAPPDEVEAHGVPAGAIRTEGFLSAYPGAEVAVSAEVGGRLIEVLARDRTEVRAGEILARLDPRDADATLREAAASAERTRAVLAYAEAELAREEKLGATGDASVAAVDARRRDRDVARAELQLTTATVRRLTLARERSVIRAPISGTVVERSGAAGELVGAGTRLFRVVDLSQVRVVAEVDEFDAARLVVGAPARVTAEGYTGEVWSGRVEDVPSVVVARGIRPQDAGRPTDTRVVQVKIAFTAAPTTLRLGQRVEVTVAVPDMTAAEGE